MMETVVIVLLAYLIGAVPSGYLIGRIFYGVDLKKTGSGNIGATNAYRTLGMKAGLAVFFCDFMKGVIAVHLGMPEPTTVLLCALFAIIGNDWSIFLKFKSGKGVACGVGAFTYICAPATIASFIVWLIVFSMEENRFARLNRGCTGGIRSLFGFWENLGSMWHSVWRRLSLLW